MIPGIDPKVDLAFKKVFGSEAYKDLTVSLINAVLTPPPDRRVVSVQLLNPYSERMTLDDKLSVLDVKARDQRGWLFNLEMQMVAHAAMARVFCTIGPKSTRNNLWRVKTTPTSGPRFRFVS
jgi:predicted transposase/invertase (TIGR01784 family)